MTTQWSTFAVLARNLPEHARNAIHTDAGAQAAGFPAALVAGVTTYAYLTHPVIAAWGLGWIGSGGGEVRFRSPVFAGERLTCVPSPSGDDSVHDADGADSADGRVVVAATGEDDEHTGVGTTDPARAVLRARRTVGLPVPARSGEVLEPVRVTLTGEFGHGYGERAGDDLDLCRREGVVHPAVWPALANQVVHTQVARGPWVHTRSHIAHHRLVRDGTVAEVFATVVDRVQRRSGERAVLDVRVVVDGDVVASLEHEAIVALP